MSGDSINSQDYWDGRFDEDWEALHGREQSRFFGALALQMLPDWLKQASRRLPLSWCDWGCALGDGTNELALGLSGVPITGIDFSPVAIKSAMTAYPAQNFVVQDWTNGSAEASLYDVVFSSNTLEHFHEPWAILERVASHARYAVAMLLPFRERRLIDEHHASFDPSNVPITLPGGKVLVHVQVRDTSADQPCYWPGEQVMLVWADPAWLDSLSLRVNDVRFEVEPSSTVAGLRSDVESLVSDLGTTLNALAESRPDRADDAQRLRNALMHWLAVRQSQKQSAAPAWHFEQVARDQRHAIELSSALNALVPLVGETEAVSGLREKLASADEIAAKAIQDMELWKRLYERECAEAERWQRVVEAEQKQSLEALREIEVMYASLKAQNNQAASYQAELSAVYASTSWQITRPLRLLRRFMSRPLETTKHVARLCVRGVGGQSREVAAWKRRIASGLRFARRTLKARRIDPSDRARVMSMIRSRAVKRLKHSDFSRLPKLAGVADGVGDVFVWAVIDWNFRTQRPQHLATAMAKKGHRVFYISNNFVDSEVPGFSVEAIEGSDRLFQVNLNVSGAPQIYSDMPTRSQVESIRGSLCTLLEWTRSTKCVSFVQHPFWLDPAQCLPNAQLVYDCMDHHGGFENNASSILEGERALINACDLLIVTSQWLEDELSGEGRKIALIRNATEFDHFSRAPASVFRDEHGRKVIGYYGAIAEWFDAELVRRVALAHPDALVLLVGRDTAGVAAELADLANVRMTGEVPYAELPYWLYGFDVCLLPFKVIPLTLATNPVKVYEYLSAGKPVVSVDLPELAQFEDLVALAGDADSFVDEVGKVLADQTDGASSAELRREFAARQTWAHRAQALDDALASISEPRVSVVVLTYNKLDYTKACLESLERYSDYPNMEVIVVDNASSDGSQDYLREWAARGEDRRFIANEVNSGFSAGNNIGLAVASGDYLVILNNDTYVTPGWIRTMISHFRRDASVGLVGPVTNNIGNEAKIDIQYSGMPEMIEAAGAYTRARVGRSFPLETAAFFCVMLSRAAYTAVGGLDERFGIGFFEDDDYCRRLAIEGFRILCAEDVFVHHQLSASFGALDTGVRQALFEKNKAIYEEKWGEWKPHCYRQKA